MNSMGYFTIGYARRPLAVAILVMLVIVLMSQSALACPSCKAALESNSDDQQRLVNGFFWSIMFMLSMPLLILSGLGTYFYLLVRKARRAGLVVPLGGAALSNASQAISAPAIGTAVGSVPQGA